MTSGVAGAFVGTGAGAAGPGTAGGTFSPVLLGTTFGGGVLVVLLITVPVLGLVVLGLVPPIWTIGGVTTFGAGTGAGRLATPALPPLRLPLPCSRPRGARPPPRRRPPPRPPIWASTEPIVATALTAKAMTVANFNWRNIGKPFERDCENNCLLKREAAGNVTTDCADWPDYRKKRKLAGPPVSELLNPPSFTTPSFGCPGDNTFRLHPKLTTQCRICTYKKQVDISDNTCSHLITPSSLVDNHFSPE